MRGAGRAVFVSILLLIVGVLNVIYGIAAVSNARFFHHSAQSAFSASLHTWGWVTIIIGVIELIAGASLLAGGGFGRVIGIIAATIGAIESLLSVGGLHPLWSLGVFAVCLWILHGLMILGRDETRAT